MPAGRCFPARPAPPPPESATADATSRLPSGGISHGAEMGPAGSVWDPRHFMLSTPTVVKHTIPCARTPRGSEPSSETPGCPVRNFQKPPDSPPESGEGHPAGFTGSSRKSSPRPEPGPRPAVPRLSFWEYGHTPRGWVGPGRPHPCRCPACVKLP